MPSSENRVRFVTRRAMMSSTVGVIAAAVLLPASASAATKSAAKYQGKPKGGQRCGGCIHFSGGRCDVVSGGVSANGWCKFFSG